MSCPNCGHTMRALATHAPAPIYWCPRCGTLRTKNRDEAPALVERARDVAAWQGIELLLSDITERGQRHKMFRDMIEACVLPENR